MRVSTNIYKLDIRSFTQHKSPNENTDLANVCIMKKATHHLQIGSTFCFSLPLYHGYSVLILLYFCVKI